MKNKPFNINQRKIVFLTGTVLLILSSFYSVSFGQTGTLTIANAPKKTVKPNQKNILSGTISDNLGAGVPDVEVRLRKGSKQSLIATTNADGNYKFSNLSAGVYVLEVKTKAGFRSTPSINIRIKDGGESQYDFTLKSVGKRKIAGVLSKDSSLKTMASS